MDMFAYPYYRLNKFFSVLCGVWPYQSKLKRRFIFSFFIITNVSFIFSLAAGLTEKWSTDLITTLETIVAILFISGGVIKCIILYTQDKQMKQLYGRISFDWQILTEDRELDILHSFSQAGRKVMISYIVYCVLSYILFTSITFIPRMLDTSAAKDFTHSFPYYFYYMIIDDKIYHYQVFVHCNIVLMYVASSYFAFSTAFTSGIKHACGLYAITRHRLENAIQIRNNTSSDDVVITEDMMIPNLINVVRQHKKAIKGVHLIQEMFNGSILLIEAIALICIAILIFDLKHNQRNVAQLARLFVMVVVFSIYIYFFNSAGEQILQECNEIFKTAYFINWYIVPVKVKKILLIIMQRSLKPDFLTAGTFIMSMENFALFLRMSWSFATVLLTTEKTK